MSLIEKYDNLGAPISESQVKCIGYPINISNTILVYWGALSSTICEYFIINSSGIGMDMNCAFLHTRHGDRTNQVMYLSRWKKNIEGWSCWIKFDLKVMSRLKLYGCF
jgi:hypothetical protein